MDSSNTGLIKSTPINMWTSRAIYAAKCSDGIIRRAYQTAEADTFFTLPCRVSIKGTTVSGFVWYSSLDSEWRFTAYSYRKNGKLLPEWNNR